MARAKKTKSTEELHAPPVQGMRKEAAYLGMAVALLLGIVIGSLFSANFADYREKPVARETAPSPAAMEPSLADSKRIGELEILCTQDPKNQIHWIDLGNAYFDAKMPQKAIQAYTTALTLGQKNPDLLTDLGIMYRQIHDYEKALAMFREAQTLSESHIQSRMNEGIVLLYDLKKKEEAFVCFKKLLQKDPDLRLPDGTNLRDFIQELSK